jgi:hypothetical protein
MKYQIRLTEEMTVYLASEPIEIDPEQFRDISEPYTGNSREEFVEYLSKLLPYNYPDDLDPDIVKVLEDLVESDTVEYSNSAEKCPKRFIQIGESDEDYKKTGGFKVIDESRFS